MITEALSSRGRGQGAKFLLPGKNDMVLEQSQIELGRMMSVIFAETDV